MLCAGAQMVQYLLEVQHITGGIAVNMLLNDRLTRTGRNELQTH